jgi:hypothetical protein
VQSGIGLAKTWERRETTVVSRWARVYSEPCEEAMSFLNQVET